MPSKSNRKRFPNNVVLEEDPYADNFPMCVRISDPGAYEPEEGQRTHNETKRRNFDIVEASQATAEKLLKASELADQAFRLLWESMTEIDDIEIDPRYQSQRIDADRETKRLLMEGYMSANDAARAVFEAGKKLEQTKRLRQGERHMPNAENYEYGADDYNDMLEHLARFVEIAQEYNIEIRRATDDDDNSGYVPLTRDYIENDGVPRLTVIEHQEDGFWQKEFSNKSVAGE